MSWFWIFSVLLCGFGVAVIVYGIRYNKVEYEHKKHFGTTYNGGGGGISETFFGAIVERIFIVFIDGFVRFFPKWLIKAFLFLVGVGFIALGVFLLQAMPPTS
ncbi:hypothetical protein KUV80_12385 [Fictibacillus nanhaiensis]|uniref:hypothetical protein n=1 Tax=Fictibacillus nanhaiensis TaxID=742169 RepID=UPI001C94298E|nr:hypothetical protein [Fictibacillus nanhaiensis]MBY6037463.1 hypothetical protein [Fictibacillus nanhaiensis]